MRIAAIDIGSNAARLLITEVRTAKGKKPSFSRLNKIRIPLALGNDVFTAGRISGASESLLIETMQAFVHLIGVYQADRTAACATAAFRAAENGAQIRERILSKTGIDIEIISGDREASLICDYHLTISPPAKATRLYVDVGGGSTEVAVYRRRSPLTVASFHLGAILLVSNTLNPSAWNRFEDFVKTHSPSGVAREAFATGGNIRKAHQLAGQKKNKPLSYAALKDCHDRLQPLSCQERTERFGLKPDRARVIVPALSIYLHFMEYAGLAEIGVPRIGLADGIAFACYRKALDG